MMGLLLASGHFDLISGFSAQFGQLIDLEV
jgi:hypothetical protein